MVLKSLKNSIKAILENNKDIPVTWLKQDPSSWLAQNLSQDRITPQINPLTSKIETLASQTNKLGEQPLWEGYQSEGATRNANQVRTKNIMGNFYAELITQRKPDIVVEFGAAFGVSGMYWLAGLEANRCGKLLSFEPNQIWADIARKNMQAISDRFMLEVGTFEENIDKHLGEGEKIDIAFIDAIHTPEFVVPQLNLVHERTAPGSIIIIDDVNFSPSMEQCWRDIAQESRFTTSAYLGKRVGILEVAAS